MAQQGEQNYQRANLPLHFRTRDQVARFFEWFQLVDPGLVYLPLWRLDPEDDDALRIGPERSANHGEPGVKR